MIAGQDDLARAAVCLERILAALEDYLDPHRSGEPPEARSYNLALGAMNLLLSHFLDRGADHAGAALQGFGEGLGFSFGQAPTAVMDALSQVFECGFFAGLANGQAAFEPKGRA